MINKFKIFLAFVISIGMLLFSYWVSNLSIPISGEKAVISVFEAVYRPLHSLASHFFLSDKMHERPIDNDLVMVDVDYDMQLVTKEDELLTPLGEGYPITNRGKLLQLLETLKKKNDYKYIMLDIAFEKGVETDTDSTLFETICQMDRIVVACDSLGSLPDSRLLTKAGVAFYTISPIEADFVKYPYQPDGSLKSMPLIMYEFISKRHIAKKYWWIEDYGTDDIKLARSSIVLKLEALPSRWYRLGDLLYGNEVEQLTTKDKIIIIGSATTDIHATYCGRIPGAVINYNAYLALVNNHHIISLPLALLLFLSYFIFSYSILTQRTLSELILKNGAHNKGLSVVQILLSRLCSWIGFSLYLMILCVLTYWVLDEVYDIFLTSTLFSIINLIVKQIYKMKHET